jgi:hypothetical protein
MWNGNDTLIIDFNDSMTDTNASTFSNAAT